VISPNPGFEETFQIQASFLCGVGKEDRFSIHVGKPGVPVPFGKITDLSVTSFGLSIWDANPQKTKKAIVAPDCSLDVSVVSKAPSENQMIKWRETSVALDTQILTLTAIASDLETLSNLLPAYGILETLLENLDAAIQQRNDLLAIIKNGAAANAILGLSTKATDSAVRNSLTTLVRALDRIDLKPSTDDTLKKYLSEEDIKTISSISKPSAEEVVARRTALIVELEQKKEDFKLLCLQAAPYIALEGCTQ
jgi:hypothetical protein